MYIQTPKYRNPRMFLVFRVKSNHGFDFFTKKEQKPGSLYLSSQPSNHIVWKLVCIILMRTRKGERERARALHGRQTRVVCQIGKALALLMLGIHSAQYKHAVAPLHYFAILAHTAYCCPHLHCLLYLLFVCLLPFFRSSPSPPPKLSSRNRKSTQQTNDFSKPLVFFLLACFLPARKTETLNLTLKQVAPIITRVGPRNLQALFLANFVFIAKVAMIHKKI